MAPEDNKELVARLLHRVLNQRELDAVDALVAVDYHEVDPVAGQGQGRAGLKDLYERTLDAFPDLAWTCEEQIAEGDKVVTRGSWRGTHRDDFAGIPATGRRVTMSSIAIHRLADGKIVESLTMWDIYGFMQQLGEIPPPAVRHRQRQR